MVTLNRIYTRTGDAGATRLATGQQVSKSDRRVEAYGAVDETNACVGLARLSTAHDPVLDAMLGRIQNELFDLGADLSTPAKADEAPGAMLRMLDSQVTRLEAEIDELNGESCRRWPRSCCRAGRRPPRPCTWRGPSAGGRSVRPCGSRRAARASAARPCAI